MIDVWRHEEAKGKKREMDIFWKTLGVIPHNNERILFFSYSFPIPPSNLSLGIDEKLFNPALQMP